VIRDGGPRSNLLLLARIGIAVGVLALLAVRIALLVRSRRSRRARASIAA